jgi:hypothetical protein
MKRRFLPAILFIFFVALLIAITPVSFVRARSIAQGNACVNNLRLLYAAKEQWRFENHKTTNDVPGFGDIDPYLPHLRLPLVCPGGGTYSLGPIGETPKCSVGGMHVLH